jgi:hypothetical protein
MPSWVKVMLLAMGLGFLGVGILIGVYGTRQAQRRVMQIERLRPLTAIAFDDQPIGSEVIVEGVISPDNAAVFRDAVAYVREELDVTVDSDGDRRETWRAAGKETPRLTLDANGTVIVGNESYSIEQGHELWYDDATLGFNDRPRDGSQRYTGLVAGKMVTAYGTVFAGVESNELQAQTIFGGTYAEYIASQRQAASFMPIFGTIFGVIGLILTGLSIWFMLRR